MSPLRFRTIPLLLAIGLGAPSCQTEDLLAKIPDADITPDATIEPEPTTYAVFLNRGGGDYTAGPDDPGQNISSALQEPRTLEPYTGSGPDLEWRYAMSCMNNSLDQLAPFHVRLTEEDPGTSEPHMEIVVAGGTSSGSTVPYTCGDPFFATAFLTGPGSGGGTQLCDAMINTISSMLGLLEMEFCEGSTGTGYTTSGSFIR